MAPRPQKPGIVGVAIGRFSLSHCEIEALRMWLSLSGLRRICMGNLGGGYQ